MIKVECRVYVRGGFLLYTESCGRYTTIGIVCRGWRGDKGTEISCDGDGALGRDHICNGEHQ
jgi:hypothetical protein